MIKSYKDKASEKLGTNQQVVRFVNIERVALRKLMQLKVATSLDDLRVPPANRLEALQGDRKGQHSIRINAQFRVCFRWVDGHAYDVEITDYH